MNKKLIVALSKQLKLDESVFEAELAKADGDESIIKPFTEKYQAYTADELATLMKNSNKQYLERADFAITEVPSGLYSKIAAASLESKEKKLAEQFGIKEYKDMNDLLTKAVESKAGKGVDELSKQQIETLKLRVQEVEKEKSDKIAEILANHENEAIEGEHSSALSKLPLDYEGEALDNQRKLLGSSFSANFKVARKDGKTIVSDSAGKPMLDKVGDPMPMSDVMTAFATQFGFKFKGEDPGGRGTGGSGNVEHSNLKGIPLAVALAKAGIKPQTDESDKFYADKWFPANKP